mgnify:FL=1|jgi:hypothetical protein
MEAIGAIILICMITLFGISALANAYESSQRHNKDEEE